MRSVRPSQCVPEMGYKCRIKQWRGIISYDSVEAWEYYNHVYIYCTSVLLSVLTVEVRLVLPQLLSGVPGSKWEDVLVCEYWAYKSPSATINAIKAYCLRESTSVAS